MKFLTILCTFLTLAAAPVMAQNEYFWALAGNATGDTVATWADNQNHDVRVSIYSSGSWSTTTIIPGSEETDPWPILIEMDATGNIIMAWGNSTDGSVMGSVKLVGKPWTAATVISKAINYSLDPILSLDVGGNATLIWLDTIDGLQASRLPAASTIWSLPETLFKE
jgi:hypothetical protein